MNEIVKLLENTKPVVHSQHWVTVKTLISHMIEGHKENLEIVDTFEEVIKIRGKISALREILNLEDSIKELENDTNLQFRGRELYRPSSFGTVKE